MRRKLFPAALLATAFGSLLLAQEQNPLPAPQQPDFPQTQDQAPPPPPPAPPASSSSDGAWHRFGDGQQPQPAGNGGYSGGYSSTVPSRAPNGNYGNGNYQGNYQAPPPAAPLPSNLTIPAGTWITIRTTNPISTEHNQAGDAFSAVLTQPVVINGVVVARRGQTIQGRISSAEKAGRVSGVSKLGLELTDLVLVDGQQIPLKSQMMQRNGDTSYGRDAAAIGTTTAVGAAIGAGVNGGVGAGVGAAAGLVASTVGVLLTRGKPAVIYPETVLTFRVQEPVTFSTANSGAAFRPVAPQDYENNPRRLVSSAPPPPRPGYYGAPYPYYAPYYYGPGYFGPSVYFGYGRGYYRRW